MDTPDNTTRTGAIRTTLQNVVLGAFACTALLIVLLVGEAVGADLDPPQLIFCGHLPLGVFACLAVDLAHFAANFAGQFAIDLGNLKFDFRYLATPLRRRSNQLRALAVKPRRFALERG